MIQGEISIHSALEAASSVQRKTDKNDFDGCPWWSPFGVDTVVISGAIDTLIKLFHLSPQGKG